MQFAFCIVQFAACTVQGSSRSVQPAACSALQGSAALCSAVQARPVQAARGRRTRHLPDSHWPDRASPANWLALAWTWLDGLSL